MSDKPTGGFYVRNAYGWQRRVLSKEPEKILAFDPQSTLASILKKIMPELQRALEVFGATIRTNTHDSFLVEHAPEVMSSVHRTAKAIMEQK